MSALNKSEIINRLGELNKRIDIEVYKSVTSTNTLMKQMAINGTREGTVIISSEQTSGRGRMDRSFYSPDDSGIYMSILIRPKLPAVDAVLITAAAAAAVSDAIENTSGNTTKIKWVNDILIDGKKVCGILTESGINAKNNFLDYAIVGIGVNVNMPKGGFPEEIKKTAAAVLKKYNYSYREILIAEIIKHFFKYYDNFENKTYFKVYKMRSAVIGKEVTVLASNTSTIAKVFDIDERCRLCVQYKDGSKACLSSGEISTRI